MIAALLAAAAAWRVPLFSPGVPFFGNFVLFFHPLYVEATRQLQSGTLALWNPYESFGLPLLADPQAGVLSPLHAVFRLFAFPLAYRLDVFGDLALSCAGAWALGRRLGLSRAGASLAALLFSAGGFSYYHSGMLAHLDSLALMPAALAFWVDERPVLCGLTLALQAFGGHPFFVYMTLAAGLFLRPRRPGRAAALALGAALLFAAALLLPQAALFARSTRPAALDLRPLLVYSLPPDKLWTMLVRPWWNRDAAAFSGDPTITSFYIGLPALLLALAGARRRRLTGAAALTLAALCLCLGRYFPAYAALARLLPGLALFRFPAQWGAALSLGAALLAGEGLSCLPRALRAPAAALVAADLLLFCAQAPALRAKPALLSLRPKTLELAPLEQGERVAHTPAFFALERGADDQAGAPGQERAWLSRIELLTPSHAAVFGVREAVSDNIARPSDQAPLDAALQARSPASDGLLRRASIGLVVDAGADGRPSLRVVAGARPRLSVEGAAGWARLTEDLPDRVSGELQADAPARAVLADSFAPGWRVWVDGRPAAPLRADGFLRAVAVPAGRHLVDWRYDPRAFAAGAALTLAALAAAAAAWLQGLRGVYR